MSTMELFSIFSFTIIYFRKLQESLKGSTVKAGLNAFFFQPECIFKLCNFNEPQPIYTYIKESILLSEESFVTFHFLSV